MIAQQAEDFKAILEANKKLEETNRTLTAEYNALDKRFNKTNGKGEVRDIGKLAEEKAKLVERIINKASDKAMRCAEIARCSSTEKEKNATKKRN